ncbi:hypothetical protein H7U34_01890 [Collinsella tanakaei]|nr:hypothetical protein [Collinsella tanakaei]
MYKPTHCTKGGWKTEAKYKRFAELYVFETGYNAKRAYELLWLEVHPDKAAKDMPSCTSQRGYEYRHKESVKREIERLEDEIKESQSIRLNELVFNLRNIAFNDENSNTDRLKAIDLLNKMGGYYTDNVNIKGSQDIVVSLVD